MNMDFGVNDAGIESVESNFKDLPLLLLGPMPWAV